MTFLNHNYSHVFNPSDAEAWQSISQLKETAKPWINSVNDQFIAASLKTASDNPAIQLSLPSHAALTRTLNRSEMKKLLKVTSLKDRHFGILHHHLPFCLYDSRKKDSEKLIIFGDIEILNELRVHIKFSDLGFKKSLRNHC